MRDRASQNSKSRRTISWHDRTIESERAIDANDQLLPYLFPVKRWPSALRFSVYVLHARCVASLLPLLLPPRIFRDRLERKPIISSTNSRGSLAAPARFSSDRTTCNYREEFQSMPRTLRKRIEI